MSEDRQHLRMHRLLPFDWLKSRANELERYSGLYTIHRSGIEGRFTGGMAILRLACYDMLQIPNWATPKTYQLFEEIVETGTAQGMRTFANPPREKILATNDYLNAISESMEKKPNYIRSIIRSIRATAIYETIKNPNSTLELNDSLKNAMRPLFEANLELNKNLIDNNLIELKARWDGTVLGFYKIVDELAKKKGFKKGKLLAYEMDFFKDFLIHLNKKNLIASDFSLKIIQELADGVSVADIEKSIYNETGIPMNTILEDYIVLLLHDFTFKK